MKNCGRRRCCRYLAIDPLLQQYEQNAKTDVYIHIEVLYFEL